jgi:hypothetical protein
LSPENKHFPDHRGEPTPHPSPLPRERELIFGLFKIWAQLDILVAIFLPITSVSPLYLWERELIFGLFKT